MADDICRGLREAYDARVGERDSRPAPEWETRERDAFVRLLADERRHTLLELGAGTGADGAEFASHGLDVVCTDLSPAMVQRCRERGLEAHVMGVAGLRFPPATFHAAYAMNCLVHVPTRELPDVLHGISRTLVPDGLLYLGVYGGRDQEGVWAGDHYVPKRFFAHHTDDGLCRLVAADFHVHSFRRIPHGWDGLHFQSLVLRNLRRAP
jgi:SAM-dependent methyltransferase